MLSPKQRINILPPKVPGTFWKRAQKECKSQEHVKERRERLSSGYNMAVADTKLNSTSRDPPNSLCKSRPLTFYQDREGSHKQLSE